MRVAHERQQAVEKERRDRRLRADAEYVGAPRFAWPGHRHEQDEQRQRRDREDDADGGEDHLAGPRVPRRRDPQRHRHDDREDHRDDDEVQVFAKQPQLPLRERFCRGRRNPEEGGRDGRLGLAVDLDPPVHVDHACLVDRAGERLQRRGHLRRPLLQRGPVEHDRVVLREVAEVVFEHPEAVIDNLGVGRIQVSGVDHPLGKRSQREVVVHSPDVGLRQSVAVAERRPAVAAIHELVAEAETQIRVLPQVGDRRQAQLVGGLRPYADGVGVVEAQRPRHPQATRGQGFAEVVVGSDALGRQNLLGDRAGVLRVGVDLPELDGVEQDPRAAELAAVPRLGAVLTGELGHDLAEDDGLGADLGADRDRRTVRRLAERQRDTPDSGRRDHAPASGPSRWLRCARTNCSTNGSAGRSRRSRIEPSWTIRPSRSRTIRSPRYAASPRSWVTSTVVLPRSRKIARRSVCSS